MKYFFLVSLLKDLFLAEDKEKHLYKNSESDNDLKAFVFFALVALALNDVFWIGVWVENGFASVRGELFPRLSFFFSLVMECIFVLLGLIKKY